MEYLSEITFNFIYFNPLILKIAHMTKFKECRKDLAFLTSQFNEVSRMSYIFYITLKYFSTEFKPSMKLLVPEKYINGSNINFRHFSTFSFSDIGQLFHGEI